MASIYEQKREARRGDEEQDLDHERLSDRDVSGEKQNGFDCLSIYPQTV